MYDDEPYVHLVEFNNSVYDALISTKQNRIKGFVCVWKTLVEYSDDAVVNVSSVAHLLLGLGI